MASSDHTIDTIVDGYIVPRQHLTSTALEHADEVVPPERLIPSTAAEYLRERYCADGELLWAIEPCTPAASIAWRDEALLRGGYNRYAQSTWFAVGTATGPKRNGLIGVINFRPFRHPEGLRQEGSLWRLGIAEAFLVPPEGWGGNNTIADPRYIKALTTAMVPKGKRRLCEHPDPRPRIATVPFASQWHASAVCGQAATYMMALMHVLPDKGGCRVEGPFSISCIIEAIRRKLGLVTPEMPVDSKWDDNKVIKHRHGCMAHHWMQPDLAETFAIRGAPTLAAAYALQKLFCAPRGAPGANAVVYHQAMPIRRSSTSGGTMLEFADTICKQLRLKLPVFVGADLELLRAAHLARGDRIAQDQKGACERFVDDARYALDQYMDGKEADAYAAKVLHRERPSVSEAEWKKNVKLKDYHPLGQVHAVVVVGIKSDESNPAHLKVLYHDPWHGPYQELPMEDFFLAATSPFISLVTKESKGWFDCPGLDPRHVPMIPKVRLFWALPNRLVTQKQADDASA